MGHAGEGEVCVLRAEAAVRAGAGARARARVSYLEATSRSCAVTSRGSASTTIACTACNSSAARSPPPCRVAEISSPVSCPHAHQGCHQGAMRHCRAAARAAPRPAERRSSASTVQPRTWAVLGMKLHAVYMQQGNLSSPCSLVWLTLSLPPLSAPPRRTGRLPAAPAALRLATLQLRTPLPPAS